MDDVEGDLSKGAITIRVAGEEDIAAFTRIRTSVRENHLSVEQMARKGITPASLAERLCGDLKAWIAERGSIPLGFSMTDGATGEVFALFVDPESEGQGAGRRLLAEAVGHLRAQGLPEAHLGTGVGTRADGFYQSLGWQSDRTVANGEVRYRLDLLD